MSECEAHLFYIQYEIVPMIYTSVNEIMQMRHESSPRPLFSIEIAESDPSTLAPILPHADEHRRCSYGSSARVLPCQYIALSLNMRKCVIAELLNCRQVFFYLYISHPYSESTVVIFTYPLMYT